MTTGNEWRRLALCLDKDPAMWDAGAHVENPGRSEVAKKLAEGRAICNTPCPARDACLADAMKMEATEGKYRGTIRGGLDADQRADLAKALPKQPHEQAQAIARKRAPSADRNYPSPADAAARLRAWADGMDNATIAAECNSNSKSIHKWLKRRGLTPNAPREKASA